MFGGDFIPEILTHQLLRSHNFTSHYLFLINFIEFTFFLVAPDTFFFSSILSLSFSHGRSRNPFSLSFTWSTPTSLTSSQTPNVQTTPKVTPFSSTTPTQMAQTRVRLGGDKFITMNNFHEKLLKLKDLMKTR